MYPREITIAGRVVDTYNKPVPYAEIRLYLNDLSNYLRKTIADKGGYFTTYLRLPERPFKAIIRVDKEGYKPKFYEIIQPPYKDHHFVTIILEPTPSPAPTPNLLLPAILISGLLGLLLIFKK